MTVKNHRDTFFFVFFDQKTKKIDNRGSFRKILKVSENIFHNFSYITHPCIQTGTFWGAIFLSFTQPHVLFSVLKMKSFCNQNVPVCIEGQEITKNVPKHFWDDFESFLTLPLWSFVIFFIFFIFCRFWSILVHFHLFWSKMDNYSPFCTKTKITLKLTRRFFFFWWGRRVKWFFWDKIVNFFSK